ncbi:GNAT family N-acetyltransferase [Candidatus Kaiserbacteria bacterium]|nr:GNAT family N-acetyltransferase [Candidatus Kaiserbacteria bacterium]
MKISRNEFGHEYGQGVYRFGYCEYAYLERGDSPADIYAQGFLPHTADPAVRNRFYMARSARILLEDFAYTSENRRIAKRFEDTFVVDRLEPRAADEEVRTLFLDYFAKRHGPRVMPPERLEAILAMPLPLHILTYRVNGELIAAVLEIAESSFGHFYYSAYDLSLVQQSLGMWLMLDATRRAKEDGRTHYYLGTVYGEKALYKANLSPLEFWDGARWNDDIARLKALARAESK